MIRQQETLHLRELVFVCVVAGFFENGARVCGVRLLFGEGPLCYGRSREIQISFRCPALGWSEFGFFF